METTPIEEIYQQYDEVLNCDSTKRCQNDICTPIACIQEMMAQVPWEEVLAAAEGGGAILDPCCGNGNFHAVLYDILQRRGWDHTRIMRTLHFNDVNQDRLANVRRIFGEGAQITARDFFEGDWGIGAWDMIVANPPYARFMEDGTRGSKNHNLVSLFVKQALKCLKPGGFLVAILPDNWMSLADRNDLAEILTHRDLIYLNIHTAKRHFKGVGSSFTWFVLQNRSSPPGSTTTVAGRWKGCDYVDTVPQKVMNFIPLLYDRHVQSILAKTVLLENPQHPRFQIETTSDLHRYTKRHLIVNEPDAEHRFRLIHTPKQTCWASRPHKYQEGIKVFLSLTDRYRVFVDRDCGMTQSIAFIRCQYGKPEEAAEQIRAILEHPLYVFLNNICRWGNFNNVRILQSFPIPRDPADIYGSFGITEEEQKHIEVSL